MDHTIDLRQEILDLEKVLESKKHTLFLRRLYKMYPKTKTISDIKISTDRNTNEWSISYTHTTDSYDPNFYQMTEEEIADVYESSDEEYSAREQTEHTAEHLTSHITFGKANKYFIKGGIKLNVYRNAAGDLRIINPKYEFDLDPDEQRTLIRRYAKNADVPECMAVGILCYIADNKWDDESIVNNLSIV